MTDTSRMTRRSGRQHVAPGLFSPILLSDLALPIATGILLVVALLFGGGTRQAIWSDAVVELACLPVLLLGLVSLTADGIAPAVRWPLILIVAILTLPLVQLIPLPPAMWTHLPTRDIIMRVYQAAGQPLPWMPISMNPMGTWRTFTSMLPAVSIFVAVLSLGYSARRILVLLLMAITFFSVGLDLLQLHHGTAWRFYEITNRDRSVGFFANANHNAALLYCTIPFSVAWGIGIFRRRTASRGFLLTLVSFVFIALYLGLALTNSRAGMGLGLLGCVLSIVLLWSAYRGTSWRRMLLIGIGINVVAILAAFQFGFVGMLHRLEGPGTWQDVRWAVNAITLKAGFDNLPFGTGLGSFVPIYKIYEPRTMVMNLYMNHATDDWAELLLEGGLLAVMIMAGFLAWFAVSTVRLGATPDAESSSLDGNLARAGAIVVILLLIHSAVDYPLRTIAIMAVFALSCSLLMPPVAHAEPGGPER